MLSAYAQPVRSASTFIHCRMAHGVEYGKATYWDDRYTRYGIIVLPSLTSK